MANHDPDSKVHELSMELKMGRQKRIQYVDGHAVEIMPGDADYEECDEEEEEEEEDEDEEEETDDDDPLATTTSKKAAAAATTKTVPRKSKEMVVNVTDDDGQRYVVLEVIQMSDMPDEADNNEDVAAATNIRSNDFVLSAERKCWH